jgi:hypothetical protein
LQIVELVKRLKDSEEEGLMMKKELNALKCNSCSVVVATTEFDYDIIGLNSLELVRYEMYKRNQEISQRRMI